MAYRDNVAPAKVDFSKGGEVTHTIDLGRYNLGTQFGYEGQNSGLSESDTHNSGDDTDTADPTAYFELAD